MDASQVRCPSCNAAHAARREGGYVCEFCLQPFSVGDARREESRILEEIKSWIAQRAGPAGLAPTSVDASSRGYIFQQKILPELKRDVDRALEALGSHGQFPLVAPPIRVPAPSGGQSNPLVHHRRHILSLKGLRARLGAESVAAFVVTDADRAAVDAMDRRVADVMYLSNVAEAAAARTEAGYSAARRNLEALAGELEQALAAGVGSHGLGVFIGATLRRYQALAELCRACEELASPNGVSGAPIAARVEGLAEQLSRVARELEASDHSPADIMPIVVGVDQEALACRLLSRWIHCYDAMTARRPAPFYAFVAGMDALSGGGHVEPRAQGDLLEGLTFVVRAARGEIGVGLVADFSWVQAFAEASRARRALGLFGSEEQIVHIDEFLVPVWLADVLYSRSTGSVFKAGVEGRGVAIVEACAPSPEKVVLFPDQGSPLLQALGSPRAIGAAPVALPRCSATGVHPVFASAMLRMPDIVNPQIRVRSLGFLPAAIVHYQSAKGARQLAGCLNGQIPVDASARRQLEASHELLQRFG
jgi:hypothetical protein